MFHSNFTIAISSIEPHSIKSIINFVADHRQFLLQLTSIYPAITCVQSKNGLIADPLISFHALLHNTRARFANSVFAARYCSLTIAVVHYQPSQSSLGGKKFRTLHRNTSGNPPRRKIPARMTAITTEQTR